MRIFLFKDGLARFATIKYDTPASNNLNKLMMHLTNYSINKHSKDFIFNENTNDMGKGHKRSILSVFEVYFNYFNDNLRKLKVKGMIQIKYGKGLKD